ncbi:PAS domain-containing protein [Tsuneonella sp. HG222]
MASDDGHGLPNAATAAEFVRQFASYRRTALSEPVFITNHGKPSHVLLDIGKYQALAENGSEGGHDDQELVDSVMTALADASNEALVICDFALRCVYLNAAATSLLGITTRNSIGRLLSDLAPRLQGTLLDHQLRRTRQTREVMRADLPSPWIPGNWLHTHTYTAFNRVVLGCRDITDDVENNRFADVKATLLEVMNVHGSVGYARLSNRATIDKASDTLANAVSLPSERMIGVPFVNLIELADRAAFREKLESVLRDGKTLKDSVNLISNEGSGTRVDLAVQQLSGAYGTEGALVLLTFARE